MAIVAVTGVAGLPWLVAGAIGAAGWLGLSAIGTTAARPTTAIFDPFTVSEPWRNLMMAAQSAQRRLQATVDETPAGPMRDTLADIADRLNDGLGEASAIATAGDQIDTAIRRLDPTRLRADLAVHEQRARERGVSPDDDPSVASSRTQLETVARLEQRSAETAEQLRVTQVRMNELVARANEVKLGSWTPDTYAAQVDELVIELEALHRAVEEVEGI